MGVVGNNRPVKRYDILLEAAKVIHKQHPESRFIVAGQGSWKMHEELIKLRNFFGLDTVLHFIGFQADAPKIFNSFEIFDLQSTSEAFSISTIEAMACGLPVVVTQSGDQRKLFGLGKMDFGASKE